MFDIKHLTVAAMCLALTAPAAAQQQQMDVFRKAFAACLEPKGYTVK